MTVSSVPAGWSYDGVNTFTYTANSGTINLGDTATLSFALTPDVQCNGASGTIMFTPDYQNICGDSFFPPIVSANYSVDSATTPTLGITKTAVTSGGDGQRIFLGEGVTFTVTPSLTVPSKWTGDIVVTDNVPSQFTANSASVTAGALSQSGNNMTWTLTPAQAAGSPTLTITTTASTDPCDANNNYTNTANITGTTTCGCVINTSASASLYLQSQEATGTTQNKSISNTAVDVCSTDTIKYDVNYSFDSGSTGLWTDSTLTDQLDSAQTYSTGTATYSINSGATWTAVPAGSITQTSPMLVIDLGFLKTVFANIDSVAGKSVKFRYETNPTAASLAPCSSAGSIMSVSDLSLASSGEDAAVGIIFIR